MSYLLLAPDGSPHRTSSKTEAVDLVYAHGYTEFHPGQLDHQDDEDDEQPRDEHGRFISEDDASSSSKDEIHVLQAPDGRVYATRYDDEAEQLRDQGYTYADRDDMIAGG